jgi:hypothetical protein
MKTGLIKEDERGHCILAYRCYDNDLTTAERTVARIEEICMFADDCKRNDEKLGTTCTPQHGEHQSQKWSRDYVYSARATTNEEPWVSKLEKKLQCYRCNFATGEQYKPGISLWSASAIMNSQVLTIYH